MRYEQNAVLNSLSRAQQFVKDNSAALTDLTPTARQQLDSVTEQLSELSIAQDSGNRGSKGETSRSHSLRMALRRLHMAPIAEIAQYWLRTTPEFSALRMPNVNVSVRSLVASASSMADAATPHVQTFIDNGLPATFLDDLRATAKALSESLVVRDDHQGRQRGATAGLADAEKRGRSMLRVVSALVLKQIGDNPQLRRQWESAVAVTQKPGRPANAQPTTPSSGQPAATTPTTAATPTATTPVVAVVSKSVTASTPAPTSPATTSPTSVPAAA
ncbi:MAG TPA: hypothetical protein VGM82_00030 [Gemmatimonadaceae bacterium]|jgi:hypothetical protein